MYFIAKFALILLTTAAFASENNVFKDYRANAKKQYMASEKTLLASGDSYVKQHAQIAERLSLAEMLPTKNKDLPRFCKTYLTEVGNYYNVDPTRVSSIKSPIYLEFSKLVRGQCFKVLKK